MATVNDFKNGFTVVGANGTQGPFTVLGGQYGFGAAAGVWGTIQLQILMPDGSTYVGAASPLVSNATQVVDLPPGTYQVFCSATNASFFLIRIPYQQA